MGFLGGRGVGGLPWNYANWRSRGQTGPAPRTAAEERGPCRTESPWTGRLPIPRPAMFLPTFSRLAVVVLLSVASLAQAATSYCAGSVAQLQEALDQAEVDGDDSLVRMRSGNYTLSADLVYTPEFEFLVPAGRLTLRGGYDADCSSYSLATG